jgi:phosphoglycolate phosphatase-like HAD superfamily hydrolase
MARLWLLDFDGTLVDSKIAIKACYLKVVQELVPERSSYIDGMVIGATLDESSRMILTDKNLKLLDVFKNRFQQLYDDKLVLDTPQYNSVDETLKKLHSKGDHLCIVTNKRAYPTHKLIDNYGWDQIFKWVACMDEYPSAQNKSDLISLKKINPKIYDAVYFVGDTLSDGEAAKEMNILFIKANYGYGKKQIWDNVPVFKNIENFNEILLI